MSEKIVSVNRKASHDYFLVERFEAGIVLTGTEIKSIRKGKVQFKDAYITFIKNEAYIKEMHIAPYDHGNIFNHDETRERKLLLHKLEIRKLQQKVKYIRMSFFNFVEKNNAVRLTPNLFRQNSAFVKTDISWRRSN